MPGIPTQLEILRLTLDELQAAGDPDGFAAAMLQHPEYANLGAIGPLIGDFLPADPHPAGEKPSDYTGMWRMLFHFVGREDPAGLIYVRADLEALLNRLQPLAEAEDCEGLKAEHEAGLQTEIDEVTKAFANILAALQTGAIEIAAIIGSGLRPKVSTQDPSDPVPPTTEWQMRNFLHWKRTGTFVQRLLAVAQAEADDRLVAYALGYAVGFAGHLAGNAFINSIVGAPARTQWWRQRFVRNYVDAWVYGYYNQDPRPKLEPPAPPYGDPAWKNLCDARLQERIEVPAMDPAALMDLAARNREMPRLLDADFAAHWFQALADVYGDELPPTMNDQSIQGAYAFTWLVLWFQTSGEALGCKPVLPVEPDPPCGDAETELDPFKNGVPIDGSVPTPPDTSIDVDVDEAAVICGIILAILGGILFLGGGVVAGGAAIATGVALLDCDNVVSLDYQRLRCLLYWQRMFLANSMRGVHRLLTLAALEFPYAAELEKNEDFKDLFPFMEPWESGERLCRSRDGIELRYPGKPWDGTLFEFNRPPASFETPGTIAYLSAAYPNFFVDASGANPLTAENDVKTDQPRDTWSDGGEYRISPIEGPIPVQFANAVENAKDLLQHLIHGDDVPNFNLDHDRGMSYLTWQFVDNKYDPDAVQVEEEA